MKIIFVAVFVALSVAYVNAFLPLAPCPTPSQPPLLVESCYNPKQALFQKYPLMYKLKSKLCKLCCDPLKEVTPCPKKNLSKLPCLPFPAPSPMLKYQPPCAPPCPPPCLSSCSPAYAPACPSAYAPACPSAYAPACASACSSACAPSYASACAPACASDACQADSLKDILSGLYTITSETCPCGCSGCGCSGCGGSGCGCSGCGCSGCSCSP